MNNARKFDQVKKALDEMNNKHSNVLKLAIEEKNKLHHAEQCYELEISRRFGLVYLMSPRMECFIQTIYKKGYRINVVPIAFMISLYKEDLIQNEILPESEVNLPYDLRGFWSMDKVLFFVLGLVRIEACQQIALQKLTKKYKNDKLRLDKLVEIYDQVSDMNISTPEEGKISIEFDNGNCKFVVNANNVKMDIVPLCKKLINHYLKIVKCVEKNISFFNPTEQIKLERDVEKILFINLKSSFINKN